MARRRKWAYADAMWVKICANTSLEDALGAVEAGADAVGFVFAASKRQVDATEVRAIARELPAGVERVGVFGAVPAEEIAAAARVAGLTAVQLHGGFDRERSARLRELLGAEIDLIETVHWRLEDQERSAEEVAAGLAAIRAAAAGEARVLVDAKAGGVSGGLGVAFDWGLAREVFAAEPGLRVILAGGLRPGTVDEAVRLARPWGVDVASGVERTPGSKDLGRVREFVARARGGRGGAGSGEGFHPR